MSRHPTTRRLILSASALLTLALAGTPEGVLATSPSPYAGETARTVKALSAAEIDDLTAGRGMGLARAAELNGYPGPMHARELAAELGLAPDQEQRLASIEASMRAEAKRLGAEILAAERALDAGFAERRLDAATVERLSTEIGVLAGRLRAVHLAAHLETAAVLTPHQIHRYDVLRGYADGPAHPAAAGSASGQDGHHHHHPQ